MFETVYAWLLRLFPAEFRNAYGQEALQVFRDRYQDERGLRLRLRLSVDLLSDLVVSLIRQHHRAIVRQRRRLAPAAAQSALPSPHFQLLSVERIRPTSLLVGSVFTLAALHALSTLAPANRNLTVTGSVEVAPGLDWRITPAASSRATTPRAILSPTAGRSNAPPRTIAKAPAVSIKPTHANDLRSEQIQVHSNGGFTARSVSVLSLVSFAYQVPANPSPRINGLPAWSYRERYNIEVNPPPDPTTSEVAAELVLQQARQTVRQLLAQHFRLALKVENKRMPVYALALARTGPHLQPARPQANPCIFDTAAQGCHTFALGFGHPLQATAVDMDDLAHYLENWTDLPVINCTRWPGLFTLHTAGWRPMKLPPPPPGAAPNANVFVRLPTIFTVLSGLGLTLDRRTAAVPVYTVTQLKRPS